MQYKSVKGFSGWGQLGILLVFFGLGFILAAAVQLLIGLQLVPRGISADKLGETVLKAMMEPENIGYARLSQVLGTFFLLFVPASLYLIVCHGKNTFWFGFNKHINGWQVLIGFFLIFFANIITEPLADLSKNILTHFPSLNTMAQQMEDTYSGQVAALSNLKSWGEFTMALLIMAFFPAMFEEIFFRGALQNLLERWWKAPLAAVIFTSIIFSVIHMSLYLFLSRAVLGFVLGLMYQRSKNIWVNIVAHFLNNTVALIQLFWISSHNRKIELDKMDPKLPLWGGLVAVGITYGLFILFEKVSVRNRNLIAFEEQDLVEKADPFHHLSQTSIP
jgi:membrane protease YdiL (CAAX protease family)